MNISVTWNTTENTISIWVPTGNNMVYSMGRYVCEKPSGYLQSYTLQQVALTCHYFLHKSKYLQHSIPKTYGDALFYYGTWCLLPINLFRYIQLQDTTIFNLMLYYYNNTHNHTQGCKNKYNSDKLKVKTTTNVKEK